MLEVGLDGYHFAKGFSLSPIIISTTVESSFACQLMETIKHAIAGISDNHAK
jgi:hypothetical protein